MAMYALQFVLFTFLLAVPKAPFEIFITATGAAGYTTVYSVLWRYAEEGIGPRARWVAAQLRREDAEADPRFGY